MVRKSPDTKHDKCLNGPQLTWAVICCLHRRLQVLHLFEHIQPPKFPSKWYMNWKNCSETIGTFSECSNVQNIWSYAIWLLWDYCIACLHLPVRTVFDTSATLLSKISIHLNHSNCCSALSTSALQANKMLLAGCIFISVQWPNQTEQMQRKTKHSTHRWTSLAGVAGQSYEWSRYGNFRNRLPTWQNGCKLAVFSVYLVSHS